MPLGADPGGYQVVHIWYPSSCCKRKGSEVAQAQVQPFIISTEGQGQSSQAPAVAAILVASHCTLRALIVVPVQSDILRGTRFYRLFMSMDKRHKRWNLHIAGMQ
jgi:hypothetical protein